MRDTAEKIHRAVYGKSGRVNANSGNEAFEWGFSTGKDSKEDSTNDVIMAFHLYGAPELKTEQGKRFAEWKRGYWAARLQRAFAQAGEGPEEEGGDA